MKGTLHRETYTKKQTLGTLTLTNGISTVFQGRTLELPWRDNQRNISCIPKGRYRVVPRTSQKFGRHYHITAVPGRSSILIHPGNFYFQIRGCVLVGDSYKDMNKDGLLDVVNSRETLDKLLQLAPEGFDLLIE